MRPLPVSILALFFIASGIASLGALAFPLTRPFMQPASVVVMAALNLIVTGTGFWTMRRWAAPFFVVVWVAQAGLVLLTTGSISGFSFVGLVLVLGLFLFYRQRFI